MNIDPELMSRLSGMDQNELADKIAQVSALLGLSADDVKGMIGTPRDIQKKLQGLSPKELCDIADRIDPAILKKLNAGDR